MKYIVKTRKALAELNEAGIGGGVNSFSLVFARRETRTHRGRVCYNVLNFEETLFPPGRGPIAFLSTIQPLNIALSREKDMVVSFLEWLMRDSPFKSVFYTKNGKRALRDGMVCHTTVSASMLIGGLSIAREVNECPNKVLIWGELVRLGMPKIYAYVATYYLEGLSRKGFQVKKPAYNNNHLTLSYPLDKNYLKNFCRGRIQFEKDKPFRENTDYHGVFALWGKQHGNSGATFTYSMPPIKTTSAGWGGQVYTTEAIVYKTEKDRQQFVREFTTQIEEIVNG